MHKYSKHASNILTLQVYNYNQPQQIGIYAQHNCLKFSFGIIAAIIFLVQN